MDWLKPSASPAEHRPRPGPYSGRANATRPDRALSRTDALKRFRALRGKYRDAARLLDVQRGIERGYPAAVLAEVASGD